MRVARIVRDHAQRRPAAVQLAEELHDRFAVDGIEISGWLVRKQDRRRADERARYRDTLLLAAGELPWIVTQPVRHADALECFVSPASKLVARAPATLRAAQAQWQLHVLVHGEITDQVERLEDEADFAIADACPLGGADVLHGRPVEPVLARGRTVEEPEDRQQRRFAAAGRPADRDVFASPDRQMDP